MWIRWTRIRIRNTGKHIDFSFKTTPVVFLHDAGNSVYFPLRPLLDNLHDSVTAFIIPV
jgi:hypothetical protein